MTTLTLALDAPAHRPAPPAWLAGLLAPIRRHLNARVHVIHEQAMGSDGWRILYIQGHDVRDVAIHTDAFSAVCVTRFGERWPSMVIELTLVDRLLILIGDRPSCLGSIIAHIDATLDGEGLES